MSICSCVNLYTLLHRLGNLRGHVRASPWCNGRDALCGEPAIDGEVDARDGRRLVAHKPEDWPRNVSRI